MKKLMATFHDMRDLPGLKHVDFPVTMEVSEYDGYHDILFIKNTEFIRLGAKPAVLYPEGNRTAVRKTNSVKLAFSSDVELEPAFGYTPVVITKSNTSFVKVGEKTHISTMQDGTQYLWSDFCQRYERLSWATRLWRVEYKEITK